MATATLAEKKRGNRFNGSQLPEIPMAKAWCNHNGGFNRTLAEIKEDWDKLKSAFWQMLLVAFISLPLSCYFHHFEGKQWSMLASAFAVFALLSSLVTLVCLGKRKFDTELEKFGRMLMDTHKLRSSMKRIGAVLSTNGQHLTDFQWVTEYHPVPVVSAIDAAMVKFHRAALDGVDEGEDDPVRIMWKAEIGRSKVWNLGLSLIAFGLALASKEDYVETGWK